MKEIQLSNTKELTALVDDDDYDRVITMQWHLHTEFGINYAVSRTVLSRRPLKVNDTRMHRLVMNAPRDRDVDHWNGNGLDNQKSNLRLVGQSENQQNRHRLSLNTSGYRGVCWHRQSKKWQAGIKRHGKSYHLGLHETREAAARAYDEGARRIYGPHARTNFPLEAA